MGRGDGIDSKLWYGYLISCFNPCKVNVKIWSANEILAATKWSAENWYRLYGMPCVESEPALACNICGKLFPYRDAWYFHMNQHEEDI